MSEKRLRTWCVLQTNRNSNCRKLSFISTLAKFEHRRGVKIVSVSHSSRGQQIVVVCQKTLAEIVVEFEHHFVATILS